MIPVATNARLFCAKWPVFKGKVAKKPSIYRDLAIFSQHLCKWDAKTSFLHENTPINPSDRKYRHHFDVFSQNKEAICTKAYSEMSSITRREEDATQEGSTAGIQDRSACEQLLEFRESDAIG